MQTASQQNTGPVLTSEGTYLLYLSTGLEPSQRFIQLGQVGMKAAGLGLIPAAWTPPFFVISSAAYQIWLSSAERKSDFLDCLAESVVNAAAVWQEIWGNGILLRSSAVKENLGSRGQNETFELPADFNNTSVGQAIKVIFERFSESEANGNIAVIVQARVAAVAKGHLSNERRVSITQNHWMAEVELGGEAPQRFNSQRSTPPNAGNHLKIGSSLGPGLLKRFREVSRWCTQLEQGRVHLEWGATVDTLWLFQIDFEDDFPDQGQHPEELLRNVDLRSTGAPEKNSPFLTVETSLKTGWKKIDKISDFTANRRQPYPKLFWITGDKLAESLTKRELLRADLSNMLHGRAICRTDCISSLIPSLNLPRTNTVSEEEALKFMENTLSELRLKGARHDEICFILHKFIPATAAAWAVIHPGKQIVRVDSLWGLPDGLQYLPHDTFEFDVARNEVSSERIRYKPKFLQETSDGSWKVIQVGRRFTRRRSLGKADLAEIATQTHAICQRVERPIQIMWFCRIPHELGIGRNIPWFSMPPETSSGRKASISPTMPQLSIYGQSDLEKAKTLEGRKHVLYINPEDPELFRSTEFLDDIKSIAVQKGFPVIIVGSILSHAFYMLDKAGLVVVAADEPARTRTRQRRVFNKIVRDHIPDQISQHGERTEVATISKSEARPALAVKLLEELFELLRAQTPGEVTAELADVLEVVRSLCAATGVDWGQVEAFATAKRRSRGSFDRNVVLIETSWPSRSDENTPSKPISIKLSDLSKIISDGHTHKIPFSTLLSIGSDRELILSDGRTLTITMDGEGIKLEEGEKINKSSRQLELDLQLPK